MYMCMHKMLNKNKKNVIGGCICWIPAEEIAKRNRILLLIYIIHYTHTLYTLSVYLSSLQNKNILG
jgi:hypothetical protein